MKKKLLMVALGAALTASTLLAGPISDSAVITITTTNQGAWAATLGSTSAADPFNGATAAFTTLTLVGGNPDNFTPGTVFINNSHAFINASNQLQDVVDNFTNVSGTEFSNIRTTTFSYNSGTPIYGIAGNFGTLSGGVGSGLILTLNFSDGTRTAINAPGGLSGFQGITSTVAFTSLTISSANAGGGNQETYTLDNLQFGLTAGSAPPEPPSIPEPATFSMMGLALAGIGFIARRRK